MIVVIADDITGAAEIAGIGWRFGLATRLARPGEKESSINLTAMDADKVDLVVIDSDSRDLGAQAAIGRLCGLCNEELAKPGRFVYKKTDSILRGHIQQDILQVLKASGRSAALLVAQNPSMNRVISQGRYLIDSVPLHKTALANDPQWPVKTSDPLKIVEKSKKLPVRLVSLGQSIADGELSIGQAVNSEDMRSWAKRLDSNILPAGSGDFFQALLECSSFDHRKREAPAIPELPKGKILIVSGSASAQSHEAFSRASECGLVPCPMPEELFAAEPATDGLIENWARQISKALAGAKGAWMAIDKPLSRQPDHAANLRTHMAQCAQRLLKKEKIGLLGVDGGATCGALLTTLGISDLKIVNEIQRGVVALRSAAAGSPIFVLKPGSYSWSKLIMGKNIN